MSARERESERELVRIPTQVIQCTVHMYVRTTTTSHSGSKNKWSYQFFFIINKDYLLFIYYEPVIITWLLLSRSI